MIALRRYFALPCFVPFFVLVLVHELGHAIAALLLGARVHSIRALGFEARIMGRRRAWWQKRISFRHRRYRARVHGEISATFDPDPPGALANLFYSCAGYAAEWGLLGWLWTVVHSHRDRPSWSATALVILAIVFSLKSAEDALSDAKGDDLYEAKRSVKAIVRRL
jgi:hypothetical protein